MHTKKIGFGLLQGISCTFILCALECTAHTIHNNTPQDILAKIESKINKARTMDAMIISSLPHAPLVHAQFKAPDNFRLTALYPSGRTVTAICSAKRELVFNSEFPGQYMEVKSPYDSPAQANLLVRVAPMLGLGMFVRPCQIGITSSSSPVIKPFQKDPSLNNIIFTMATSKSPVMSVTQNITFEPNSYSIKGFSMDIMMNHSVQDNYERVVSLKTNTKLGSNIFRIVLPRGAKKVTNIPHTFLIFPKMPYTLNLAMVNK